MKDSLKEERLKILDLLEQGKIKSGEATELLGALKVGNPEEHARSIDLEDKFNKFCKSLDIFAKDVSDKVGEFYKDVEPKVKEVTKKTIEKTVTVVDDLSKTLNESLKSMEEDEKKSCCKDECCEEDNENNNCCEEDDCCDETKNTEVEEKAELTGTEGTEKKAESKVTEEK